MEHSHNLEQNFWNNYPGKDYNVNNAMQFQSHSGQICVFIIYMQQNYGLRRYPRLPFDSRLRVVNEEERKSCPNEEKGSCKERKCPVQRFLLLQPFVFAMVTTRNVPVLSQPLKSTRVRQG
eukprot:TRINITY_DN19161_c0_g1_i1.p1 TRINITY_DN19161_c0_g1~~TRINITY_DN19161_c0_g1_i1.p1  ORF type:complete len:121 (+),score=5.02 TRINITY_DN19161_c0_g1_i1:390-752(+)